MAKENSLRGSKAHSHFEPIRTIDLNPQSGAPIGVFDSGVGGLSVLRALQSELPDEQFVYVADSGHAPYGERDIAHVLDRSHAISEYLINAHQIKLLVVACNTATAAAIHHLRETWSPLPVVGIEPALKPATAGTVTGLIAVMATRSTLNSEKFRQLQLGLPDHTRLILQPCDGLAGAIECNDHAAIEQLCKTYMAELGPFGKRPDTIDSLVLGCTHYPFIAERLSALAGPDVQLYEAGSPVARQTRRLLERANLLRVQSAGLPNTVLPSTGLEDKSALQTLYYTSGDTEALKDAVIRWLGASASVDILRK